MAITAAAAVVGARSGNTGSTHLGLVSPFFTPAPPAPVVDANTKTTFNRSCERTAQSQTQMNECAASELDQLQSQLNTALAFQRRLSDADLIDKAESAFESYEKAECTEASWPNTGGSIYPLVFSQCEINLTVQRIEQIRSDFLGLSGGH